MENAGNPRVYKSIPNSKKSRVYKDTVIQKDGGSYNMAKIDAKSENGIECIKRPFLTVNIKEPKEYI